MNRILKNALLALPLAATVVLTGCAAYSAAPVYGFVMTNVSGPLAAPSVGSPTKVGRGTMTTILGLIASGDASIESAAKSAGITKIHHVDFESKSTLGIIASWTVVVYGE